ncbi:MAG: CBS domain-containing protein [Phycisphaerae bacterium]|nr:CBS domain-containing protein [Phycisphaerae bacterium]
MRSGTQSWEAVRIFEEYRVDELPVVNEADEPVGLMDVQDLVTHKVI